MPARNQNPDDIVIVFPTPVLVKKIPETEAINQRLRELILARALEHDGVEKSNVGGWHSATDFFEWPYPEAKKVLEWVGQSVKAMTAFTTGTRDVQGELTAIGWVNLLRQGAYNTPHSHPDSMWSGVYYVDVGSHPAAYPTSGVIEFLDPRCAVEMISLPGEPFREKYTVHPESGMLVLFPSWLYHYVHPYQGEDARISISFNAVVTNTNVDAARMRLTAVSKNT